MADPLDELIDKAIRKASGEVSSRPLQRYTEAELRQLWRAERITEEEWKAELMARGDSAQQAVDTIARQKQVGVSTAASTAGQLTASEQSAVEAFRQSLLDIDSWENPARAAQVLSSVTDANDPAAPRSAVNAPSSVPSPRGRGEPGERHNGSVREAELTA